MLINLGAGNLQFCIIWLLALRRIWVLSILQRSICLREQFDSRRIAWDATYSWGVVRLTEKNFKFPLRTFQMARKEIIEANDNRKWTSSREALAKHTCYNAYSRRSPMFAVSETVGTHSPPRKKPNLHRLLCFHSSSRPAWASHELWSWATPDASMLHFLQLLCRKSFL